jgi:hypothetical protein
MAIQSFFSRREPLGPAVFAPLEGPRRYLRIVGYFRSPLLEVFGEALETVDAIRVGCNEDLDSFDVKVEWPLGTVRSRSRARSFRRGSPPRTALIFRSPANVIAVGKKKVRQISRLHG